MTRKADAATIRLGATARPGLHLCRDTVAGFLAAAASNGAVGNVVNIGTNFEISVGGHRLGPCET